MKQLTRHGLYGMICFCFNACYKAERLKDIGSVPVMTRTQNPIAYDDYVPVSIPMTSQPYEKTQPNSLWRAGARTFFKDQRASRVGDILTVIIKIDDRIDFRNTTTAMRNAQTDVGLGNVMGFESKLGKILPHAVDPSKLINMKGKLMDNRGSGQMTRQERVETHVAVLVTQVLPNGNLVVSGRQEARLGFEVREVFLTGIIRPEDITAANTILWNKIAEARLSYSGRGDLSDAQRPSVLQEVINQIF